VEGDVPHRFGESGRDTRDTCDTRRNAGFSVLGFDRQTCDSTCDIPTERPFDGCSDEPDADDDEALDPSVPVTL